MLVYSDLRRETGEWARTWIKQEILPTTQQTIVLDLVMVVKL